MVPIKPTRTDHFISFFQALSNGLKEETTVSRKSKGITREMSWLQKTQMGDFGVVYLEGNDVNASFSSLAKSSTPFDLLFKERVLKESGLDLTTPMPPIELHLDFNPGKTTDKHKIYCFACPVVQGKLEDWKKQISEIWKTSDAGKARLSCGVVSETAWLMQPPQGPAIVTVCLVCEDVGKAFQGMGQDQSEFGKKFQKFLKENHDIDLTKPAPPNQVVFDLSF